MNEIRHCTSKQRHKDAAYALLACMIVHQTQGWNLFPYKCQCCEFYHIGHTNGAVRSFIEAFMGVRIEEKPPLRLTYSLGDVMKQTGAVLTFNPAESGPGRDLRFSTKTL